jgi:hypothetical protein
MQQYAEDRRSNTKAAWRNWAPFDHEKEKKMDPGGPNPYRDQLTPEQYKIG